MTLLTMCSDLEAVNKLVEQGIQMTDTAKALVKRAEKELVSE